MKPILFRGANVWDGSGARCPRLRQEGELPCTRAAAAVKRAVRCGVDVIYHCVSATRKRSTCWSPRRTVALRVLQSASFYGTLYEGEAFGFHRDSELGRTMQRVIDTTAAVYTELRKRGVRILIGAWVLVVPRLAAHRATLPCVQP